ncbi:MAG: 2-hydroxyacid dehydrogenase [Massilibacteroides sp.]|nr:2-hydroxyacid dehydrogenase [Massilibacteroides sp.]
MNRIIFFDSKEYDHESFTSHNAAYGYELEFHTGRLRLSNISLTKGYEVVCIFVNDDINKEVLANLAENGVKLIALRCAGFNNVDIIEANRLGIRVVRVPAYSPYAVAEHALALMMALNRHIPRSNWRTRDGNFTLNGLMGFDMHGKTAGIIGTGRIAKILIYALRGMGMKIVAYDLYPDKAFAAENGVTYTTLNKLYAQSDIISLHCPLTSKTRFLIDEKAIGKMKKGVMLINTSRGKLIYTHDLINGLKNKQIGFAGLDVYEEEAGYFYEDRSDRLINDDMLARLLSFNNVIVTSHQGFFTREALTNIADTTLENITAYFTGKELVNEVLPQKE